MSTKRILAVISGAALLALLVVGVTGCGSSTTPSVTSHTFTSATVNGHSHTVVIDKADVQTPPALGLTETTSSSLSHTHTFDMTQAQLMTVNSGTAVVITTGTTDAAGGLHAHDFTISKWF